MKKIFIVSFFFFCILTSLGSCLDLSNDSEVDGSDDFLVAGDYVLTPEDNRILSSLPETLVVSSIEEGLIGMSFAGETPVPDTVSSRFTHLPAIAFDHIVFYALPEIRGFENYLANFYVDDRYDCSLILFTRNRKVEHWVRIGSLRTDRSRDYHEENTFVLRKDFSFVRTKSVTRNELTLTTVMEFTVQNDFSLAEVPRKPVLYTQSAFETGEGSTLMEINENLPVREYYDVGSADCAYFIMKPMGDYPVVVKLIPTPSGADYFLCTVRNGLIDVNEGLNVSPFTGVFDADYTEKESTVYQDNTIRIITRRGRNGVIFREYVNWYRVDDSGWFDEVRESDLSPIGNKIRSDKRLPEAPTRIFYRVYDDRGNYRIRKDQSLKIVAGEVVADQLTRDYTLYHLDQLKLTGNSLIEYRIDRTGDFMTFIRGGKIKWFPLSEAEKTVTVMKKNPENSIWSVYFNGVPFEWQLVESTDSGKYGLPGSSSGDDPIDD